MASSTKPIYCQSVNGLGNDLFIAAAALEQATRLGTNVTMFYWKHNGLPEIAHLQLPIDYSPRALKSTERRLQVGIAKRVTGPIVGRMFVEKDYRYDPRVFDISAGTEIVGFFQSPKYFPTVADLIRQAVTDRAPQDPNLGRGRLTIHLRLGDYLGLNEATFHGVPSESYYLRALNVAAHSSEVSSVDVHSDSPEEAVGRFRSLFRRIDQLGVPWRLLGPGASMGRASDALSVLSQCDSLVMSNSTFSWWGAFTGTPRQGLVVFPRPWFASRIHDTDDLCLPDWASLGAEYGH